MKLIIVFHDIPINDGINHYVSNETKILLCKRFLPCLSDTLKAQLIHIA